MLARRAPERYHYSAEIREREINRALKNNRLRLLRRRAEAMAVIDA
jgi:hypothetical protein